MGDRMYHFVYKTTNILTSKYYIGKHSTTNLNDGYFGSGSSIRAAVNKHGRENFTTHILEFFDTEADAIKRESEIVTREFCALDETYNINTANQGFTWTGKLRPDQSERTLQVKPWLYIKNRNTNKGKPAHNRKQIRVTNSKLDLDIIVDSLRVASEYIGMDRANARKILQGAAVSRKGYQLTLA